MATFQYLKASFSGMDAFLTNDRRRFYPHAKICRLCGGLEGPFINIYGNENNLLSKITILPIVIDEFDSLPHKICYICSAKLTEFKDFIEKCTRTQVVLCEAIGKTPVNKFDEDKSTRSDVERKRQKDLHVVLTRLEDDPVLFGNEDFNSSCNPDEDSEDDVDVILSDESDRSRRSSTPEQFGKLNVSGFETVYTCKLCDAVLIKKQLTGHKCNNANRNVPKEKSDPPDSTKAPQEEKKRIRRMSDREEGPSIKRSRTDSLNESKEVFRDKRNFVLVHPQLELDDDESRNESIRTSFSCLTKKAVSEHIERMKVKLATIYSKSAN